MAALLGPSSAPNGLFASAIDNFLADVQQKDAKDPFFQAISALRNRIEDGSDASLQQQTSQQCAQDLLDFIRDTAATRKGGRAIRWLNKLEPFVSSLTCLARTCEGLLQASPFAVAIVFAGARVMLNASLKIHDAFDVVLEAIDELNTYMTCYQMFHEAHSTSPDLQQNLTKTYVNILKFWQQSTKFLSGNFFKTLTKEIVRPIDSKIKECLRIISADRARIQYLVQATESRINFQIRSDRQRECIVAWIRAGEDPSKLIARGELDDRLEVYQHGTCTWILDHPGYLQWRNAKKSTTLWQNGPPGSGKTMLASHVADTLRTNLGGDSVIWHFCSFNDPVRKHPINVFRSLALQILKMTPILPDRLITMFKEDIENEQGFLTYHRTLEKVIHELLVVTGRVHILIDGLDECLPADATPLLGMITRLVSGASQRHGITKWFFTSRKEGPILKTMSDIGAIEVSPTEEDRTCDIQTYLQNRLRGNTTSTYSVERLAKESDGNFLVAKLRADTVLRLGLTTEAEVEDEMAGFPSGLTGCYLRSLESLQARSVREQELARRTILTLIGVLQPLTLNELLDALAVRSDSQDHAPSHIPNRELIQDLCGSFLNLDSQQSKANPVIKLAHKSVQDFFFSDPAALGIPGHLVKYFTADRANHLELGRNCLTYLNFKRYSAAKDLPDDFETNPEHAFLRYAAVFWFAHLDYCGKPTPELRQKAREFVRSPAFWTCVRVQIRVAPYLFSRYKNGGCGFNPTSQGFAWNPHDAVAWVFPSWLGDTADSADCQAMLQGFHSFVLEWYPTLSSGHDALRQLPMDPSCIEHFPGRAKLLDKSVKRMVLGKNLRTMGDTQLVVSEAYVAKGVLKTRMIQIWNDKPKVIEWRLSAPFSKAEDSVGTLTSLFSNEAQHIDAFEEGAISSIDGTFAIGLKTLAVRVMTPDGVVSYPAPGKLSEGGSPGPGFDSWRIIGKTRRTATPGSRAVAYQLIRSKDLSKVAATEDSEAKEKGELSTDQSSESEEEEDEYDEEEESSGAEQEPQQNVISDASSSDSDEPASDESDPDLEVISTVLIIVSEGGKPAWITEGGVQSAQIAGSFHPILPQYAWTSQSRELCFLDTLNNTTKRCLLPEPFESTPTSSSKPLETMIREVKFSSDGQMHLFILRAEATRLGITTFVLNLSSYLVNQVEEGQKASRRMQLKLFHEVKTVRYQFGSSLRTLTIPHATSFWSDDEVYIILPLMTCSSTKVLRFALAQKDSPMPNELQDVQTLSRQIFIPSTTVQRNPRLLYQTTASKPDDSLYLVLDADPTPRKEGADVATPNVLRWTVPRADGWRAWDPDVDGLAETVKRGISPEGEYQALRGCFVSTDRTMSVQIRGALDMNRKAFLSCA